MLAILTSLFAYDPQRIGDIIPAFDLYIPFVYLFVDGITLTALFVFPACYSTPSLSLLQTAVLYLTLYIMI